MKILQRVPILFREALCFGCDPVESLVEFVHLSRPGAEQSGKIALATLASDGEEVAPDPPQSQTEENDHQKGQYGDPRHHDEGQGQLFDCQVRHSGSSYTDGMRPEEVKALLTDMTEGNASVEDVLRALRRVPVENLGFAQLDTHRELRQGMPEAVYAAGKTPEQVLAITARLLETTTAPVLITRVPPDIRTALLDEFPEAVNHSEARLVVLRSEPTKSLGSVAVVSAGTSDLPVAQEAAYTAEALGASVEATTDVGVAGVHRILAVQDRLHDADVVIVVAGMEGALASLVGGISSAPVIAVPTSVGYGASFDGLAALLAMLNSCAAGVTVVNIDNGFGAAVAAIRLLRKIHR